MSESQKNENKFITFEYKEIIVRSCMESIYTDAYIRLGWKIDGVISSPLNLNRVTLKFKRDRRIENKSELDKLQLEFENQIKVIEKLETSKEIIPSAVAYGIGLAGTAFMTGATFSYLAQRIPLCIVLAVPAFIGWILPYFAFRKITKTRSEKTAPAIDRQYDVIYEICEKAGKIHVAN